MTTDSTAQLVRQIHGSGKQFVLAVTGGGSGAIAELLQVPGASRSVLEATVPYSAAALVDWLGGPPEQFCSEPTARRMAMAAWRRARKYAEQKGAGPSAAGPTTGENESQHTNLLGLACTASLASDRPKRGAHRAFLAVQSRERTVSQLVRLESDARDRQGEEQLLTRLILNLAASQCGVDSRLEIALREAEQLATSQCLAPSAWQELMLGQRDAACQGPAPVVDPGRRTLFPGAFNPLHRGHCQMAEIAQRRLNRPVEFEISIENVDKSPLDFLDMQLRAGQFAPDQTLWLTRAPTFVRKSELFPRSTFLVGADTVARVADARYYGSDEAACRRAIEQIAEADCGFLVFARSGEGGLRELSEMPLPAELRRICEEVPAEEFRVDVSSTELRKH